MAGLESCRSRSHVSCADRDRRSDGTFRVVGLPGPGVLGVRCGGPYLLAHERDDEEGTQETQLPTAPYSPVPIEFCAFAKIDPPENAETFVHRVGRTGRAVRRGVAYTFVNDTQRRDFDEIKRKAKVRFRQERLSLPKVTPSSHASPAPRIGGAGRNRPVTAARRRWR